MPLNLSRKPGEKFVFAHDGAVFTVQFVRWEHGKAYLAIDAPASVRVFREEVWERIKDQPELVELANPDGKTF